MSTHCSHLQVPQVLTNIQGNDHVGVLAYVDNDKTDRPPIKNTQEHNITFTRQYSSLLRK
jgi:hypothetical protein